MRFTKTIASASLAAVLGLAGVSVAGATSNTASAPASASTTAVSPHTAKSPAARRAARKARRRHARREAAAIAATTIGITHADLLTELKTGKTIAAIATEHGVQPQAVITAIESAASAKINAAQSAGKITSARAAKLTARLGIRVPRIVNTWHLRNATAG